jgi:hypothetical protein
MLVGLKFDPNPDFEYLMCAYKIHFDNSILAGIYTMHEYKGQAQAHHTPLLERNYHIAALMATSAEMAG